MPPQLRLTLPLYQISIAIAMEIAQSVGIMIGAGDCGHAMRLGPLWPITANGPPRRFMAHWRENPMRP